MQVDSEVTPRRGQQACEIGPILGPFSRANLNLIFNLSTLLFASSLKMAPKSKSIFRQPGAQHFQLVHRSQRDPLIHDPEASQHVLKAFVRENDKKVRILLSYTTNIISNIT